MFAELVAKMWKQRPPATDHVVVGKVGRVTDRIAPGRLGSVMLQIRGGSEEFYARADGACAIAPGQLVEVIGYAPPRTVSVQVADQKTLQ